MFTSFAFEKRVEVKIEITGFPDNIGMAFIGIYREVDAFPEMNEQYKGKTVSITNKSVSISFTDLPNVKLAVAVFHDRNKNGIMDKNILGIPTEHYGFSNNARELFSAPSFVSASFTPSNGSLIKIKLH